MASGFRVKLKACKGGLMSYMRGGCYIWRDDDRAHVWAEDGSDGWDDTSWAEGRKLSHDVGMRLAELVCEQRIGAVVESAVASFGGNGGCLALQKLAASLISTLEPIGSDPAATEVRSFWRKARDD